MPVTYIWDDADRTIAIMIFRGAWMVSDYDACWRALEAELETLPHPVSFIADLSEAALLPTDIVSHIRRSFSHQHPQIDQDYLVGASPFVRMMAETILRMGIVPFDVTFAATRDEARAMIAAARGSADRT